MREGSHRLPKRWLWKRYDFLDEEGVPKEPDWKTCGAGVAELEDMEDPTAHGVEGDKVSLASWKNIADLKAGVEEPFISLEVSEDGLEALDALSLQKAVKERQRDAEVNKLLTDQSRKKACKGGDLRIANPRLCTARVTFRTPATVPHLV